MNTTNEFYILDLVYSPGHNILELYSILVKIRFTTSKTKLDIQYRKIGPGLQVSIISFNRKFQIFGSNLSKKCVPGLKQKNLTPQLNSEYSNQSTIPVIIFWHFLIIQHRSEQPQVKRYLISTITNLVHELPHELPTDLTQSSFQKLNFDNSYQKHAKLLNFAYWNQSRYHISA